MSASGRLPANSSKLPVDDFALFNWWLTWQRFAVSLEIIIVLGILLIAVALFISERVPVDVVALMLLGTLLASGLVTAEEGFSGFASPATITVGAMFVLSAALHETGAVGFLGRALRKIGHSQPTFLLVVMLGTGLISAFVNNTAAVAVFLPLILASCARRKIAPSKVLIPLSYASQFGGVCTLIGTSTNLLVSALAVKAGYEAFTMFEFGKLGIILLIAGTIYFMTIGHRLLPHRRANELTEAYNLRDYITELRVLEESPLIGKAVRDTRLREEHDITVLEILRDGRKITLPLREVVQDGDILLVEGSIKEIMDLKDSKKLAIEADFKLSDASLDSDDSSLVEVLVAPRSKLIGTTLRQIDFRRRYRSVVLAIQRQERTLRQKLNRVSLQFGDAMLLRGPQEAIHQLRTDADFIVLQEVEAPALNKVRMRSALIILALTVGLAAMGIFPIHTTAILGIVALILTRCLSLENAYASIDWKVILLLAGILPLGIAMEKSGAAELISNTALGWVPVDSPVLALAVLYLLTAVLTETMSNNASAVLLAPIAISLAERLGVDPKPFLMAVCFAASTSFATPVGYQTNTMVYTPGGYKFADYLKVGIPLNLIFWGIAIVAIPLIWPFN